MTVDEHVIDNIYLIVNLTLEIDIYTMLERVIDITYHAHELAYTCYWSVKEAVLDVYETREMYLDPKRILVNTVYNFGHIFDAVRDMVLWFQNGSQGEITGPYDAGYALGTAIYLSLLIEPHED